MKIKFQFFILLCAMGLCQCSCTTHNSDGLPDEIQAFISKIEYGNLGTIPPKVQYDLLSDSLTRVNLTWTLKDTLAQDDWQMNISPKFNPDFHWAPHLTPTNEHIIAQHVFRAPALIVSSPKQQLTIIPDLDILQKGSPVDWYMDMDATENRLTLGLSESQVKEHVLFVRKKGAKYPPGKIEFGFYIMTSNNESSLSNPWREVLSFFWGRWGKPLYDAGEPLQRKDLAPYIDHTFFWAFDSWKKQVWQEFDVNGKIVGAPAFIVNVTQSPNYPGKVDEREFKSIWNQAWFSSLRSAHGVYRYAKRNHDQKLMDYALKTKELALAFPQKSGFFPGLIATEMKEVKINDNSYHRSQGWETHYFGNSNRNPYTGDPRKAPYHILDMSWTAYLMLTWYDELEKDERLLNYATTYADALLKKQDKEGFFPGWLDLDSLKPLGHLNRSPETSMSVTFLLKLYNLTKDKKFLDPALKAMQAVIDNIVPTGRWEDFETYWSCSRYGSDTLVNQKVERNDMYKQNNFSMYWTAQALLNCYKITNDKKYIDYGQRTLDEMLMTQATWQPPYIHINSLGGFGVMNADGEWNDSRQSLFSELILRYGRELKKEEYVQRGLSALRASFVMMYCPENPKTKLQWERKWNFFGKEDYGFMMENYGHSGTTSDKGIGIGEFTIYDWGNGAASEAYIRMVDHLGNEYLLKN